jgi:hypothetical protein
LGRMRHTQLNSWPRRIAIPPRIILIALDSRQAGRRRSPGRLEGRASA